ncbi:hypothetical protein F5J12DRAFT_952001 [Pisolithus orientalis]|uniref:uncharacterized protein n=1 Tax=Pisolithus orientalis TaxID=936130 RepID=UPI002224E82A|nr:uncharacterized protein F5J12DRAFT_952001 [Pisolithus orientalis]KAI5999852.1 hypothetical protein F5J12DRAFT_952001 [Pisolithus orientalis]
MAKASVSVGTATECGSLAISWTGGQSSFWIFIFPSHAPVSKVNYSSTWYPVPSSAYSGNQGNYTIPQLPLPQGQQFVLSMYDGAEFITGGTSDLLQVAGPTDGSSCNTTSSQTFSFEDSSLALQQCGSYLFDHYQGAVLPVSIMAIIPGGESIILQSDVTTVNYTWTANVQAGTSIIFSMLDANDNSGGCSPLQTVGASNDASCLGSTSALSTANIPQSSQPGSSSPSATQPSTISPSATQPSTISPSTTPPSFTLPLTTAPSTTQAGSSSSTALSTATIAGVVGGGVVALAALVIFGLCLVHRKRRDSSTYPVPMARDVHPYQGDHDQPFVSSGRTIRRISRAYEQETHSFHRASSTLQQGPFVDTINPNFAAHNDTGIPLGPSFAGSAARHNIVVEHTPSALSQATDPPPQYSERPGPAAGQRSVPRPLSSGTDLAYVPRSFDQIPRYLQPHSPR